MKKLINTGCFIVLLFVLPNNVKALNFYWIGGTGNWDDLNHWATTPGGTVLHNQIPRAVDDVFFDANSFNDMGQTVTLNPLTILCNNMDWTTVTNMPSLAASGSSLLKIYGSLKFSPAIIITEFHCAVSFEATTGGKTITLAGNSITNNVSFNGIGGGWSLLDTFNVGWITFSAGTLTTNNQTINTGFLESRGTFSRTLNMGSSTFNISSDWYIEGTGITLNCGTSVINCTLNSYNPIFSGNNLTYYDVNFTGSGVYALFKNGNRFHDVVFYGNVIMEGLNTFHSATFKKDAEVVSSNNYTNITFEPGYSYSFYAGTTQSVSGTINAAGNCGAYVDISSNTQGSQFTISHPAGAVNISFAILKDVLATGGAGFTASSSIDISNNSGWSFTSPAAHNLYWVGNSGNWNDGNHWSFTSGGASSGCSPTPLDNIFFDVNSFSLPAQAVAINIPTAYCRDIIWTGVTNTPSFTADFNTKLKIYGSLKFSPAMMLTPFYCSISFEATTGGKTITMSGLSIPNNVSFNGIGGGWSLLDTFNVGWITFSAGTLTTNNQTINTGFLESRGIFSRTLNMGSSTFNISSDWYIEGTGITLNCGTSVINCTLNSYNPIFSGNNLTYYDVNFTGSGVYALFKNGNRFHDVVFYGNVIMEGLNTFHSATFKKDAEVVSSNNYTNITFEPGYSYSFYAGTTQSVSGTINAAGNCGAYVDISSNTQGSQFTISHPAGAVNISFAILKDVLATGGAGFTASSSIDISNNSGWSFTSPAAHNLYWVGNSGNWNDGNHWSFTSGGASSGCSPTPLDNIFFDVNSFSLPAQAVAINIPTAYCRDIIWTGVTNTPSFTADFNTKLKIYGSLKFSPAMMLTPFYCSISFEATTGGKTITMSGLSIPNNVSFNGIGGGWSLLDTFNVGWITFSAGTLTTNNQTINTGFLESRGIFSRTLNMGSSTFNISSDWYIEGTGITLNCGTSVINCTLNSYNPIFSGNNLTYYDVNFTGSGVYALFKNGNRFHDVVFYGNVIMEELLIGA